MTTFLVTSTGGTVGSLVLDMIRQALDKDDRLVAADAGTDVSDYPMIDAAVRLPFVDDAGYEAALTDCIRTYNIDVVLPLSEEECLAVSRMFEGGQLDADYLGMSYDTLSIITDKIRCSDRLRDAGIDVPEHRALTTMDSFETALADLRYPDCPVVIKPKSARGSRGFRIVSAQTNRLNEMARKGGPIFIDLDQVKAVFAGQEDKLENFFLMEFLSNGSASVDLVAWNGQALGIFPHIRMGYPWGFVDHARITRHAEIEAYCTTVIAELGLHGMCNIEVGWRADGSLSLIEVNGRTSATVAQNMLVGANSMAMILQARAGRPSPHVFHTEKQYRTVTAQLELKTGLIPD